MKKILVIQLRQLGDILLTTPVVRELKRAFPQAHIVFLCHPMGRHVLKDNPFIDELWTYEDGIKDALDLAKRLRSQAFDCVLDFMANPRSLAYSLVARSSQKIAIDSPRRFFYDAVVKPPRGSIYIVDEKFELLRYLKLAPQDRSLTLVWKPQDLVPWHELLKQHPELEHKPLRVALSPTHRREHRRWPLGRYVQFAEYLVEKKNAAVIWIWGPGEGAMIDEAIQRSRIITYKAPKTTIQELTALLSQLTHFVGNSNGPSHLAVAADIASLQLHGHTHAASWCPMTPKHRAIESQGTPKKSATLESITVDQVIETFEALPIGLPNSFLDQVIVFETTTH